MFGWFACFNRGTERCYSIRDVQRGGSVESSVAGAIIEANVWSMAFASGLLFLAAEMLVLFRQECV